MDRLYKYCRLDQAVKIFLSDLKKGSITYYTNSLSDFFENYSDAKMGRNNTLFCAVIQPVSFQVEKILPSNNNSIEHDLLGKISSISENNEYDITIRTYSGLKPSQKVSCNLVFFSYAKTDTQPILCGYDHTAKFDEQKEKEPLFGIDLTLDLLKL